MRTREAAPRDWAKTQNNLAIAYIDMAERSGDQAYVARAAEAYRAALSETPREDDPLVWATLMNNLGDALTRLGGEHLEEAVSVHRAALAERPRERVPLLWAASQENLGSALVNLGKHQSNPALIKEAIAAYDAALEVGTRERVPLQWSGLHYNLGNAYGNLADFADADRHLRKRCSTIARRCSRRPSNARRSSGARRSTCWVRLWSLGEERSDNALRRQGVEAQRESLKLYTRERNAADWAITVYILGTKYHRLGLLERNQTDLQEATQHWLSRWNSTRASAMLSIGPIRSPPMPMLWRTWPIRPATRRSSWRRSTHSRPRSASIRGKRRRYRGP